jgi:ADP-ribosylarginine hydrolase
MAATTHERASKVDNTSNNDERTDIAKFKWCMQLAALGDALAFQWEFEKNTKSIRNDYLPEVSDPYSRGNYFASPETYNRVSDDTIMHLATVNAVATFGVRECIGDMANPDCQEYFARAIFQQYVACLDRKVMADRAPGIQSEKAVKFMAKGKYPPYSSSAGGNGAAMRTMCLGLVAPHQWQASNLVAMAVIASAATHNHPTAIFGGVMSAVFTSFAFKLGMKSIGDWPAMFFGPVLMRYVQSARKYASEIRDHLNLMKIERDAASSPFELAVFYCGTIGGIGDKWEIWSANQDKDDTLLYFLFKWFDYLKSDGGPDGHDSDNVKDWDKYWRRMAYDNGTETWPGSSGHDAPMMAYDALRQAAFPKTGSRKLLFLKWYNVQITAAYHGGDSDSTATIAGAWLGASHSQVAPEIVDLCNFNEFVWQLDGSSLILYDIFTTTTTTP